MHDNQPRHRQQARRLRRLMRRQGDRAGLPAVLVHCEGAATERNYLQGFCAAYGINGANVTIRAGAKQTDAASLVERARREFQHDGNFDRVFVVCDKDGQLMERARASAARSIRTRIGSRTSVELVVSDPCFEYWLLLHFEYSTTPYPSAREVKADLRTHITDYDKADPRIFQRVAHGVEFAETNALRAREDVHRSGATCPGTDMPEFLRFLRTLSRIGQTR